ncbi:hypothetical protein DITRI_Ditri16bG0034300 [Diplodiscus trichospermus]
MDSKMVSGMLIFICLVQVTQFPSINFSKGKRDATGVVQFSDSFHQVSDCGLCSSFHQEDQHIAWEMEGPSLNRITGPKIALSFRYLYGNSTPTAFLASLIAGMDDFITKVLTPGGELVLPKPKLGPASSAMYKIRNTYDAEDKELRIGVHMRSNISQFVSVDSTHITGFSIRFKAVIRILPYNITYKLIPFDTSYDRLVKEVALENFDAAVGDIVTTKGRYQYVGFSLPYENAFRLDHRRQGQGIPFVGKFRIGVPVRSSSITHFVGVDMDENHTTYITRFSIAVFEAAVRRIRYKFTCKLIHFYGSSDELVKKVANETFDVAIGKIVTTAGRYQHLEFSMPYLEPGFMMVVKAKNDELNKFWWFLSPFTPKMWIITAAFNVVIGAIIWIIEGQDEDGPNLLEALFFVHRRPLQSNAARILKVLWVFVLLILTQVYTSMLTTMLTNSSRREQSILGFDSLRRTDAPIGCDGEYQTICGNISAAFLLTPYAKAFLAEHCADFTEIRPSDGSNPGGLRFVFPEGSPLETDISEAILELKESGELQLMEDEMSSFSDHCSNKTNEDPGPIGPSPFRGFFVICGGTSVTALLFTLIKLLYRHWEERIQRMLISIQQLWLWLQRLQRVFKGREFWPMQLHRRRILMGRELWRRQLRRQRVLLQLPGEIEMVPNRRNEL